MLWHSGDVYDAVNKVKESKKYLFVFIRDQDTSQIYIELLEKSVKLHGILNNSICLNLLKDTEEYRKFSDVYKVEEIPSIYVITHQGELVEVINHVQDEENLYTKLLSVYGMEKEELTEINSRESLSTSDSTEICNESEQNINTDDKMVEVRKRLAEKHKQKLEEEKEKEKEDELKRRELGRQLNQLKQVQKDKEDEDIKAQMKRKRDEEKEARDKILRQIEDDKIERKQRFSNQILAKSANEEEEKIQPIMRSDSEARLQFRFPNGSSINRKFESNVKFLMVREFVADHVRNNLGCNDFFEIKQFFPRRTILTTDDGSSLAELQLVPSASFAVSFISKPVNINPVSNILNWTFAPVNLLYLSVISILQWIVLKFRPTPQVNHKRPTEPSNRPATPNAESIWEERQRRLLAAESRTIMKDGNLAGFKDSSKKSDDDEDEARWNGNSTQQM